MPARHFRRLNDSIFLEAFGGSTECPGGSTEGRRAREGAGACRAISEHRRGQNGFFDTVEIIDWNNSGACTLSPRRKTDQEATMPIILWLLGVPLSLIIVLALLGVF
jgi:hypothetical protein